MSENHKCEGNCRGGASALMNVDEVAQALMCSTRHVYRLADGGKMPRPIKLGALVRWRRDEIHVWVEGGCRPVKGALA